MMTKVELTRFRIKKGKEAKAQEWMDLLNEHHVDTVATMAGEKMYVESVFKEKKSRWLYLLLLVLGSRRGR